MSRSFFVERLCSPHGGLTVASVLLRHDGEDTILGSFAESGALMRPCVWKSRRPVRTADPAHVTEHALTMFPLQNPSGYRESGVTGGNGQILFGWARPHSVGRMRQIAIVWESTATPAELRPLDGFDSSEALAINVKGLIVGRSFNFCSNRSSRPCVWFKQQVYELPMPPPLAGNPYVTAEARLVTPAGLVVGTCLHANGTGTLVFWRAGCHGKVATLPLKVEGEIALWALSPTDGIFFCGYHNPELGLVPVLAHVVPDMLMPGSTNQVQAVELPRRVLIGMGPFVHLTALSSVGAKVMWAVLGTHGPSGEVGQVATPIFLDLSTESGEEDTFLEAKSLNGMTRAVRCELVRVNSVTSIHDDGRMVGHATFEDGKGAVLLSPVAAQ